MRPFVVCTVALVLAAGALAALGTPESAVAAASPVSAHALSGDSPCVPDVDKWAFPPVILLGETVDITMTVRAVCAGEPFPLHIVLVLDGSGSMAGSPSQQMKQAAAQLIRRLEMDRHPTTRVGVVEFNSMARTLSHLTNEERRAVRALSHIGANGGTRIDSGILEGVKVLRQGSGNRRDVTEVLVVLSDGENIGGAQPVLRAAYQVKSQGVLVITICAGTGCDEQLMRQVASGPRYYFRVQNASGLAAVFQQIQEKLLNISLKKLVVKDTLSEYVQYVPQSAEPEQASPSDPAQWIQWEDIYVPKGGVTYTMKVQPLVPGYVRTTDVARGELTDNTGRSKDWTFPVPWVTVLQPNQVVTPETTPPAPTVTSSPMPTLLPSPTATSPLATSSPTHTPTARPKQLYLPIALREWCEKSAYYPDVALVLDMSSSMLHPLADPKLTQVLESARYFLGLMHLEPDADAPGRHAQAAVTAFNSTAWIELGLSDDRGALIRAIDNLPTRIRAGTRLDLAIEVGAQVLNGPTHKPENEQIMIVLTDGLPNRVPYAEDGTMETTILRAAEAAKAQGITIYTIGVGVDDPDVALVWRINVWLLTECAGPSPGAFYQSPTGHDLQAIYDDIWATFDPCHGRHNWSEPWPPTPAAWEDDRRGQEVNE